MKKKKIAALLVSAILTASLLTACGSDNTDTSSTGTDASAAGNQVTEAGGSGAAGGETVTLTFFDKNSGTKAWDDRIAAEVTKRTGINIEIQSPTGDPAEKLALLLAGRDYPDIVLMERGSDIVTKYIESGALIVLDDLIEEQGPNIKEMYGDTLNKTKSTDGHNYYLSNWYGADPEPVAGFIMRYDFMVEIVGQERADSDEPFTQDEMIDILKQFKEKYPTVNGTDSIGITMNGDSQSYFGTTKGMYGIKTYYEEDGVLFDDVRDPNYIKMLHFLNEMYRNNLLDKEWVVNNTNLFTQKLASGNVMGALCAYWDVGDANTSLKATNGKDSILVAYKVLGDGVAADETSYGGRSSLGWDAIGITNNCKNVDAAMRLIDFLASQEGQDLLLWGIEGEDYTIENGKYTPNPEVYASFKADSSAAQLETGITKWTWFVNNKAHDDGTPNRLASVLSDDDVVAKMAWQNLTDTYWDTAVYDALTPQGNTPEGLKNQKVEDVFKQSFAKIVNASSAEEVDTLYAQMIADMEAAGLLDVERIVNENYQQRMELWGISE